jgi:hypothetical protein
MSPVTVAEQVVNAAGQPDSTAADLKPLIQEFFNSLQTASPAERLAALEVLGKAIDSSSDDAAAFVAMVCGALVEQGAPGEAVWEPLRRRLSDVAHRARVFHDACACEIPAESSEDDPFVEAAQRLGPQLPRESAAWKMLDQLFPPAVAVLSSSATARKSGGELVRALTPIREQSRGAFWITKLLTVLDDEPFLAIEPAHGRGIVGRMTGISENFQLNVLLMDVFPGQSNRRVSKKAAAIARGEGPQQSDEILEGCWNLSAWTIVRADGSVPDPKDTSASKHWIWNEGIPADIPVFEGYRVILLLPATYERSWKSQRDFSRLAADLTIERELTGAEVKQWIARMSAEARAAN